MIQDGSVPILQPITFSKKLSASDAHLTVDLPGNVDRAGPAAIVPDGRYVSTLPRMNRAKKLRRIVEPNSKQFNGMPLGECDHNSTAFSRDACCKVPVNTNRAIES